MIKDAIRLARIRDPGAKLIDFQGHSNKVFAVDDPSQLARLLLVFIRFMTLKE
jgi:hypothetical protein